MRSRRKIFLRIFETLADLTNLTEADFVDWEMLIVKAVGVVNALEL
jgi:hypothetical protein